MQTDPGKADLDKAKTQRLNYNMDSDATARAMLT